MQKLPNTRLRLLFTLLNIVVGWHLLYEGLIKIITPTWTSASYLVNAKGIFAGIFQSIAESPSLLLITDLANMVGLTLIGLCILLGLFTRFAAIAGALLIGLYYVANPPMAATGIGFGSEGHYLIVNKNLIEIVILILVAAIPKNWYYGIGHLLPKRPHVPKDMNHTSAEASLERRAVLKNLISLPVLGGFAFAFAKNHGWKSHEEESLEKALGLTDGTTSPTVKISDAVDLTHLRKPIPKGKIGDIEFGRMICGGNLISGFSHSRDLIYVSTFIKRYFTDKKVLDTFWLCEECGINTTAVSARPKPIELLQTYWKAGGKMKWIAPVYPKIDNFKENIDIAIDNGANAAMIMGNIGDEWARSNRYDLIAETLDYIKSQGVPAGLAGHEIATIKGAEAHNVGADFYMKTLHSRKYWSWNPDQEKDKMIIDNYSVDNYWERTPEETIAFMESLDKPWIAFKVLAAGAIQPKEGFRYAFENGADFINVGMFDYQIVENANLVTEILDDPKFNRNRKWMA